MRWAALVAVGLAGLAPASRAVRVPRLRAAPVAPAPAASPGASPPEPAPVEVDPHFVPERGAEPWLPSGGAEPWLSGWSGRGAWPGLSWPSTSRVLGALGCGLASSAALALAALGARRVQAPPPAEPPQTELTDLTPAVFVSMFDTGEEDPPLGIDWEDPGEGFVWVDEEELQPKSKDIPSHKQLDYTEDGEPVQLRFAYVDEGDCIGCTYCADIARNTFFMHEEAGRARVFDQGGDTPDVVMEAIDACPVNCISFVDLEDLTILETEREGQVINQAMIGVPRTWQTSGSVLPPTKAKLNSGRSMVCCNNCPGRGCKDCPMYGIGQNPIYLERLEERQAKKEASGEAEREREELRRQEQLDLLNAADYGAFEAFDAAFAPPDDSMLELGAADSSGVLAAVDAPELAAAPNALDASAAAAELESRLMQRASELEAELLTIAMRSDTKPR